MVQIKPNIQNGLKKESAVDCFQVRSISEERLIKRVGTIDIATLYEIKEALKKVFEM
jgi:mRNA interferase MazF